MLRHSQPRDGNFGDDLNPWLWSRLAPEIFADRSPTLFLGIGSILNDRQPSGPIKVVYGSGYAYGRPPVLDATWRIYAVRGPRTAQTLGLDPSLALTDPAMLVRRVPLPSVETRFSISFMPHHQSLWYADWNSLCRQSRLHFIDPRASVDEVLKEIRETTLLLSEAMHGAIVADALRVPWIPVRLYVHFSELKWNDWAESLGLPLSIHTVPPVYDRGGLSKDGFRRAVKRILAGASLGKQKWRSYPIRPSSPQEVSESLRRLEQIAKSGKEQLSHDRTIGALEERLLERLDLVRAHWRRGVFEPPR